MANYSERRMRRLFGPRIAIVAGILVALFGIYFIVGISGNTDKTNAECTEETVGTITASDPSEKDYSTTIEYTPGFCPMTATFNTKEQYEVGTEITVKYHPTSFTKVYIEGISETGKKDVMQGIVFILAGVVLAAAGIFSEKLRKQKS